jgi:hypothetical protein
MPTIVKAFIIFATCWGAMIAPPTFAQAPVFVLPSLDGTTPASHPPASTPQPAPARPVASSSFVAPATTPTPPNTRPATTAITTPTPTPHAPATAHPATDAATAKHHQQPEPPSETAVCRKRYADAVYNIGLALWTAPEAQHRVLERLLNAAAAAQAAAADPEQTGQSKQFCSDQTLSDLEATVVRLKAKGWVPLTDVEEHAATTTNLNDELKHAINGISK